MTYDEFHKQRRMFVVAFGSIFLAPEGTPQTHQEWLMCILGKDVATLWLRSCTRGYFLDDRLVLYAGENEFNDNIARADVVAALKLFKKLGTVNKVGLGAVPADTQPWPCKRWTNVEAWEER